MGKYSTEIISGLEVVAAKEKSIFEQLRIFQTVQWLNIVGTDLSAVICYDDSGAIKGYLPLVKTSKVKIRGYHVPPYTPYSGPVILETDIYKKAEILETLLKPLFKENQLDFVLRFDDGDIIPFSRLGFLIEARQTHIVDKSVKYDIQQVHPSKRRYLKKLIENVKTGNFIVKKGRVVIDDLMVLNQKTEDRAGFRGKIQILHKLVDSFGSDDNMLVVYTKDGLPLAGAFCPRDSQYAYHLINASDRNSDSLLDKTNLLSTYLMVQAANADGLGFDFEGSNIPGVANFYRMMGGTPTINFRMQKSRSRLLGLMRSYQRMKIEQYGV